VTSGAGRDGPGPGAKAGTDGLAPDPARTDALAGTGASGEVGGMDLAAPEVKDDQGWEVMVGAFGTGLGPEVTAGVGWASLGP
jgi:hypothetical protein